MDAIGGYFELADYEEGRGFPHPGGILLNTGRNALEFILRSIGNVRRVYLPYYTCEVVLEPLKKLSIPWTFYRININLEMDEVIDLAQDEYLIVNNYFGIKDKYIEQIASVYGERLIVDCAQAFFAKPIPGIKSFYSCRKFVGVADGGIAYIDSLYSDINYPEDDSTTHDSHLYTRKQYGAEAGFKEYQENERRLDGLTILSMSSKTKAILAHIDFNNVIAKRRCNWKYFHKHFFSMNQLKLLSIDSFLCPMVYPLLVRNGESLRNKLISKKVFIAKYWPNMVEDKSFYLESFLSTDLVCLPCDQRYSQDELDFVLSVCSF